MLFNKVACFYFLSHISYVEGPLLIRPASEDNYGVDACSIICLPTQPVVIVISTLNGNIFHAIVTDTESEDHDVSICSFILYMVWVSISPVTMIELSQINSYALYYRIKYVTTIKLILRYRHDVDCF